MRSIRNAFLFGILAIALGATPALSQSATLPKVAVVADCSTIVWTAGNLQSNYVDTTGKACGSAPAGSLPTGAATAAKQDTGNSSLATIATNSGAAATAAKQDTGNTSLSSVDTKLSSQATAALQSTGNTALSTINTTLGSPLQAGGTVTANLGTIGTAATAANQATANTSLSTIATNTGAATPAGTNLIGKVGIDQTTPGSTNAVAVTNLPSSVSTGTGAQGASSPRVTVATDTATIAGSAPGTALNASTDNVVDGVTTTGSASSATTILTFSNTAGYGYILWGCTSVGSTNTIVVDAAADGATFNAAANFYRVDTPGQNIVTLIASPSTAMMFSTPVTAQAMRLRVSVYTSGTVTCYGTLKRGTPVLVTGLTVNSATILGGSTTNNGTPGNAVVAGAVYNASGISATDTKQNPLQAAVNGALLNRPFATYSNEWSYAAASGGISNTTTAVTIKAADATRRNCLTSLQLMSGALGAATEVAVRDGAAGTVVWRGFLSTAGLGSDNVQLDVPVCNASTNTLLEVVTLTATITGAVYFNAQGFLTP